MAMARILLSCFCGALIFAAADDGFAEEATEVMATKVGEGDVAEPTPTATGQIEPIKAIVRGFYVDARMGGGFTLVSADMSKELQLAYPDAGVSEELGAGAHVHFSAGYDISEQIALQLLGGATLISGRRTADPVRDLSLVFGGVGARLAIDLTNRLDLVSAIGVAFISASNSVDEAESGVGILGNVGLEYYVHIRHFSVGVDLSVLAPMSPFRLFLGISPTVKYTF
ncbi:MAG: hypothetical protein A2289_11845 [Deltaproteobacteria bacterium RIFOXYA12_FULL_58_15]|nr:MAG: hypothetical protein A2289_11845 [Deltaproteobacteria bacterium RIFOXYA12_FULL_58_15]OGR10513.1 MAG: hypothetical protein A2341_09515 [Deltaproteobacteria bacterium RIFOXYB12_FULL_58_9]